MSVSCQVQTRLLFIQRERRLPKSGGLQSPAGQLPGVDVFTGTVQHGAVSVRKTVAADGTLSRSPAAVKPTLLSDLSATFTEADPRAAGTTSDIILVSAVQKNRIKRLKIRAEKVNK